MKQAPAKRHRRSKGDGCYGICRADLLEQMSGGAILWQSKYGFYLYDVDTREQLHPLRPTVRGLIDSGVLVISGHANPVQQNCGMQTYHLATTLSPGAPHGTPNPTEGN